MPEFWIQLENRPWDVCPHNIDRITGENIKTRETVGATPGPSPVSVTLASVNGGPGRTVQMFKPLTDGSNIVDALIYRRYKPPAKADLSDAWTVPDDRKINAWDLNEPDPSENGTMGTIPGPVIEGNVGDSFVIHFRNMDNRKLPVASRCHSIHPHGVVFKATYDGGFPLSPSDPTQPVGGEAVFWSSCLASLAFSKKAIACHPAAPSPITGTRSDGRQRRASGCITTIRSATTTTSGLAPLDSSSFTIRRIQQTSISGSPPIPRNWTRPSYLEDRQTDRRSSSVSFRFPSRCQLPFRPRLIASSRTTPFPTHTTRHRPPRRRHLPQALLQRLHQEPLLLQQGDSLFQVAPDRLTLTSFGLRHYRVPPTKQLTLQLFHALGNDATCINGRQYLGNTPTIVSGPGTQMRFGVVGMGSEFHTFHLHGHRWVIPGPGGNSQAVIQGSVQDNAVSQFEDTRTFGPANSLAFSINGASGSFMRAGGPSSNDSLGEWHMHCHVMMHMMTGMMGSLLIVQGGEAFTPLPVGVPCPDSGAATGPGVATVILKNFAFNPATVSVKVGDTVHWVWQEDDHSVTADDASFNSGVQNTGATFDHMFMAAGTFPYFCKIHGAAGGNGMSGKVIVTP